MRTVAALILMAVMVVAVAGQVVPGATRHDEYTPAIMGRPPAGLKKPIIFAPTPVAGSVDADAPITGPAPKRLVKSAVSENIYGGVVEFVRGRTAGGCKCRKALPEKYRYDAQYRAEHPEVKVNKCGCPLKAKKPEDKLPPVVARLYPHHKNHSRLNGTHGCKKNRTRKHKKVAKIAPAYYPKRKGPRHHAEKKAHKKGCKKEHKKKKIATISPEFYPVRRSEKRKARKAAKKLKSSSLSRKAKRAARKAKEAAKKAARKAKRAARKAARAAKKAAKAAAKKAKQAAAEAAEKAKESAAATAKDNATPAAPAL